MQIKEQQSRDSIRIVWNVMASNRTLQAKAAVPQAFHYTPLYQKEQQLIDHIPPKCSKCDAFMNPYNRININKTQFKCCICKNSNELPENYLNNQGQLPVQMTLDYSSFVTTQRLHRSQNLRTISYLFVVDTSIAQKELDAVKEVILDLVNALQDHYKIGLITYNKYVSVYDLMANPVNIHSFSPQQSYQPLDFMRSLDLGQDAQGNFQNKFIYSLAECRQNFQKKVNNLTKLKQAYKNQREARATGFALNLALSINSLLSQQARIVFFCGGPCTIGQGKVIEQDFKIEMRSIKQQTPALSKKARNYYTKLAERAMEDRACIDSFIFSVQETGFADMREALTKTGGLLVQHEEFDSQVFRQSFKKAYQGYEQFPPSLIATRSAITVKCSDEIVVSHNYFFDQLGQQKKRFLQFVPAGLDQTRTFTFQYQLSQLKTQLEAYYIQIVTVYSLPQNLNIRFKRVTTIRRLFSNFVGDLVSGFDSGAALALLSKSVITKPLEMASSEVRQWLDNVLCKWAQTFAEYRSRDPLSFQLAQKIKSFPQFVYNLRRNPIARRSGLSLDELAYISAIIKKQSVQNIILIIQPALVQYNSDHNSMRPIPLDEKYMKAENILLLDSFFNVVEWRGSRVAEWISQNYHQHPQHAHLANLLKTIQNDIGSIKNDRFPVPHYYLTHIGHSKQRFIKSRLSSRQNERQQNLSDEVDVNSFIQKLIELVVNKQL